MASSIKNFNFNGCQHLRKLVIGEGVEFKGLIDLTDTPIKKKNDISKVDPEFKNVPDGVSLPWNVEHRAKLATTTASVGTQTDKVEIVPIGSILLTETDKATLQLLKDGLFYFDLNKEQEQVLRQKQLEIKKKINITGLDIPNENIRLLAEHILLINEKVLENVDYFRDLKNRPKEEKKEEGSLTYQELVIKNKELEVELSKTKVELQKELSWWDKWINDEPTLINGIYSQSWKLDLKGKSWHGYFSLTNVGGEVIFEESMSTNNKNGGEVAKKRAENAKKALKAIGEYYKNQ